MIKKIINIANGEIGLEIENENKYTNANEFVNWCMIESFGEDKAKELLCQPNKDLTTNCYFAAKYYKNNAQYYTIPQTGDQIFIKNEFGEISSTGIVTKVDENNIYTVEVIDNVVCAPVYAKNDYAIAGYGRPNYEELPEEIVEETNKDKKDDADKNIDLAPITHKREEEIKGENIDEISNQNI